MRKKIIFMGTPDYANKILIKLIQIDFIEIIAIFTQPDKPVGRKKILTPPIVKLTAEKYSIPIFQPHRLKDKQETIQKLNPDFIVVAAYGQILSQAILDIAPSINLHTSILPKYRGASPIQQTIINNDFEAGVTAMKMELGLDSGDILAISRTLISKDCDVIQLYDKLTIMASELIIDVLKNYNNLNPLPQQRVDSSYCKKISKSDGLISFENEDSNSIYRKYLAFKEWPNIYLESGLKLIEIEIGAENHNSIAGKILEINKNSIEVACKTGTILIKKVQPKSKKAMDIKSYLNGYRLNQNDFFI
jgi:methionyl-tRNA formyltransferase